MHSNRKVVLILFLTVFVFALLGVLIFRYIGPYGKTITYSFVQNLPNTDTLTSLNKTDSHLELGGVVLKTKTSRFSLDRLRNLQDIKVHLAYKPGQSEIKLGVRGDESHPFSYRSLYFAPLANMTWDKSEENGLILYQKNKQFASVTDFLTHLPTDQKIGLYQVDPNQLLPFIHPGVVKATSTIISTPIRGSSTAYILSTGGDIIIKLSKQDINLYDGTDILNASLSLSGVEVAKATIGDDGFADKSQSKTAPQTTTLTLPTAKPGVYKLELKFDSQGSDSFISKIEINQAKVIFGGSLLTWGGVPTTVYTSAPKLTANTSWPEFIQNLKLNDKIDLGVKTIKTNYDFDLAQLSPRRSPDELYKITLPKGDVYLTSLGYFSFAPEAYFDPQIIDAQVLTTTETPETIGANYDYILTTLQPTTDENGWTVSNLSLNPTDYVLTGPKIFFELSVPDMDKHGGTFEIGGFDVTLISQ